MRNPLMLTLTKESGEALTLMKGDEVIELRKERADLVLFSQIIRYADFNTLNIASVVRWQCSNLN